MKKCNECNAVYENNYNKCPTCSSTLVDFFNTDINNPSYEYGVTQQSVGVLDLFSSSNQNIMTINNEEYNFETKNCLSTVINGAVSEINTQPPFFQTRFAKWAGAVFTGEPVQFGYSSFKTVFRIEEHSLRGYPEQARDVIIYGNTDGVLAVGDDLTIKVRRSGSKYIARRIFNHSTGRKVSMQICIPALFVRVFTILLIITLIGAINALSNINYADVSASLLSSLLPIAIIGGIVWYAIKTLFGRKV